MIDTSNLNKGIVYQSRKRKPCLDAALVLESLGISSEVLPWEGHFLLIVRPDKLAESREQLRLYFLENREEEGKKKPERPGILKGLPGSLTYVSILLLVDSVPNYNLISLDLNEIGSANAALIRQGECWRAVTALTLHADFPHLIGNIGFGLVFSLFASQILGSGVAWLSILIAGTAGNIVSAFIHSPSHNSIGASTAVFAALGIVAAHTWRTGHKSPYRRLRRWMPIIGGMMLLGLLGGPGERIDVTSHITGFISGAAIGAFYGRFGSGVRLKAVYQAALGTAALLIVITAWLAAG
ncbi:MAG: rhomboid family intramembrane serine protease [Proteobacteria bacterium]|nr:rhomboid family intramembrane serine protease [Pseudomonadota bacterium]